MVSNTQTVFNFLKQQLTPLLSIFLKNIPLLSKQEEEGIVEMKEERVHDWGISRIWGETVGHPGAMVCSTVSCKAVAALARQEQGVSCTHTHTHTPLCIQTSSQTLAHKKPFCDPPDPLNASAAGPAAAAAGPSPGEGANASRVLQTTTVDTQRKKTKHKAKGNTRVNTPRHTDVQNRR